MTKEDKHQGYTVYAQGNWKLRPHRGYSNILRLVCGLEIGRIH